MLAGFLLVFTSLLLASPIIAGLAEFERFYSAGQQAQNSGDFAGAAKHFKSATAAAPTLPFGLIEQARALIGQQQQQQQRKQRKQLDLRESISLFRRATAPGMRFQTDAQRGDAFGELAQMLQSAQRADEAVGAYQEALRVRMNALDANDLGQLLGSLGRHTESVDLYRTAIEAAPRDAALRSNAGGMLQTLARAQRNFITAATADVDAAVINKKANALRDEAGSMFEAALRLAPGDGNGHLYAYNLGSVRTEQHQYCRAAGRRHANAKILNIGAKEALEAAVALKPDFAEAHRKLGLVLDALASDPDHSDSGARARCGLSGIDEAQRLAEAAVAALSRATNLAVRGLSTRITLPELRFELHDALLNVKPERFEQATLQLRKAAAEIQTGSHKRISMGPPDRLAMRIDAALSHMLQYTCRWDGLEEVRSRVSRDLNRMLTLAGSSSDGGGGARSSDAAATFDGTEVPALTPMRALVWLPAQLQKRLMQRWAAATERAAWRSTVAEGSPRSGQTLTRAARRRAGSMADRLHLGYVGADFGDNHPVTELMGGVIGAHATAMGVAKYSGRLGRIQCFSLAPVMPRAKVKQVLATAVQAAQQQQAKHADGDRRYEYNGEQQAADRWERLHASLRACRAAVRGTAESAPSLVDLTPLSDSNAAAQTQSVDVLVDLNGYTGGARPEIFAQRPSNPHTGRHSRPLHMSYLGWPTTMGASFTDYAVLDPTVAPPESARNGFSEALALLPRGTSFFVTDQLREAGVGAWPGRRDGTQSGGAETRGGDATGTMAISSAFAIGATAAARLAGKPVPNERNHWHAIRAAEGLPMPGDDERAWPVVLANFNQVYKIDEPLLDSWANALRRLTAPSGNGRREGVGAVLWLLRHPVHADVPLRSQLASRGVDSRENIKGQAASTSRLFFSGFASRPEFRRRHTLADLFLDNTLYNAGATAVEATWAGLPIVTMPGERVVQRLSLGLLEAMRGTQHLSQPDAGDSNHTAVKQAQTGPAMATLGVVSSRKQYEDTVVWLARHAPALAAWKRRLRSMLKEQHERQQRRARSHSDANATNVHGALFETAPWVRRFEMLLHNAWEARESHLPGVKLPHVFGSQMRHAAFTDTGS